MDKYTKKTQPEEQKEEAALAFGKKNNLQIMGMAKIQHAGKPAEYKIDLEDGSSVIEREDDTQLDDFSEPVRKVLEEEE